MHVRRTGERQEASDYISLRDPHVQNPNADLFLLSKDALYDVCRPLSMNRLDLLRDMGQGLIGQPFFLQVGVGQTRGE